MRGICFRWWARWLMLADNMSFLEELCWAMAAVWRHLLKDAPSSWHPTGRGINWRCRWGFIEDIAPQLTTEHHRNVKCYALHILNVAICQHEPCSSLIVKVSCMFNKVCAISLLHQTFKCKLKIKELRNQILQPESWINSLVDSGSISNGFQQLWHHFVH